MDVKPQFAHETTEDGEFRRQDDAFRDRVSERERFFIAWRYYHDATQNWDMMLELARTWTATYPREPFAFNSLAAVHNALGQHDQAVELFSHAIELDPGFEAPIENLADTFRLMNRFAEAKDALRRAVAVGNAS